MSFTLRNLSVLNYANGFTLWHQKVNTFSEALEKDYFNPAHDLLAAGDMVFITSPDEAGHFLITKKGNTITLRLLTRTVGEEQF